MRTETVTQTIENIDVHVLAAYTAHRSVEIEQQAVCCEVIALTSMYKRLVQGTHYALHAQAMYKCWCIQCTYARAHTTASGSQSLVSMHFVAVLWHCCYLGL